jgi:ribulose kinase
LTCKWSYQAHLSPGWQSDFLEYVGLSDILEKGRLPLAATPPGQDLGPLTRRAASELGLSTTCRVGVGLIDAHAGALGVLGKHAALGQGTGLAALIAGTSSSVMSLSQTPVSGPGLWGPSFGAALPNLWLTEGGQSATGSLLDYIIRNHSAGGEPTLSVHRHILERVAALRAHEDPGFAANLHVLPDFQGNRTPLADSQALGVISGLTLDSGFDDLCRLYWRTAVALALGTRRVLETFADQGIVIDTLYAAGGMSNTPQLMTLYADATGCSIAQPTTEDAVLLGSSMVAATAAGIYTDLATAAEHMDRGSRTRSPDPAMAPHYDRDYHIFRLMQEQRQALEHIKRI